MYNHHGGYVVERPPVVQEVAGFDSRPSQTMDLKNVAMFEVRLVCRCQNKVAGRLTHQPQGDSNSEVLGIHVTFLQNKCKAHRQARRPPPSQQRQQQLQQMLLLLLLFLLLHS